MGWRPKSAAIAADGDGAYRALKDRGARGSFYSGSSLPHLLRTRMLVQPRHVVPARVRQVTLEQDRPPPLKRSSVLDAGAIMLA